MNNVVNFKMILEINQLLKENNIEYSNNLFDLMIDKL